MNEAEKIARLENVLGTLIVWLRSTLGNQATEDLLYMLTTDAPKQEGEA